MHEHNRAVRIVRVTGKYEGDSEDDPPKVDLENAEVKAAIASQVEAQTKGLKGNRDEILGEKRELQGRYDTLAEQWKDLDPVQVKGLLDKIANDEDTRLIAEGKTDQVIERRTEALRRDAQTKVEAATTRASDLEGTVKEKDSKIAELVIDAAIKDAALEAGVQPSALADIVLRSRQIFALNEDYEIEARKPDGTLIVGKEGKGSLTPGEWLSDIMKELAPHWWAPSNGGGVQSGRKSGAKRDSNDNIEKLSPRQKLVHGLPE
ncbi:MAG: hypothetical protein GY778_28815 [bacterium]|nr:hypothetical protein [bacterium]